MVAPHDDVSMCADPGDDFIRIGTVADYVSQAKKGVVAELVSLGNHCLKRF